MKRYFYSSVFALIAGIVAMMSLEASASPKILPKIVNSGNASATGGNGGNATGKGAQAGNGGSAAAKAGSVTLPKSGQIINSGNASATGGNGGNAKGNGAKGGSGGDAIAVGGNIGPKVDKIVDPVKKIQPKKVIPIDPGIGNGKGTTAGGGGGGAAKAGDANAKGGNGGNATGPGAKGGNGGDAIAVSGNGNTVINGNNNTIIGKQVNNNISVSIGGGRFGGFGGGVVTGGGAFASGGFGGDGVIAGSPGIAVASTPSETVITTDGTPAIARGQDGQDNVGDGEKESVFTRRFLKVKNDSDEPMKVFVQYRGMDDKKWAWFPVDPSEAKDALVYDLKPGQEMYLMHKESKLSASRVRIWGEAESQNWLDFRDQDLWVVPEMDQRGEHRYLSTEMKTFTFVFPKQTKESK